MFPVALRCLHELELKLFRPLAPYSTMCFADTSSDLHNPYPACLTLLF
jgi:hypothetical protein